MKKFPCPDCGSKDNLVQFPNGAWCFTPDCPSNKNREPIKLTHTALSNRKLNEFTLNRYGVGLGPDGNLWAPYYTDGRPVAYKVRTKDKQFYFEGNAKKATLFGMQACSGTRGLTIVEGELDALAAHQMTGYNTVSVRNASSAAQDVRANLEWVESHDRVYVCLDMDTPGRKAADEVMAILKPGKAVLVNLPEGYKDACDMLVDNQAAEFKRCLYTAKPVGVTGVISDEDLVSKALSLFKNESSRRGVSTGFESLDYLIGGFRSGEVTVLVGGTGTGKSRVSMRLALNVANQGEKVFFIPLEMQAEVVTLLMAEMALKGNVLTDPHFSTEVVSESIKDISENVKFFDHFGSIDPVKLLNTIEYVCRVQGTKFVVLDHISAVVNGQEDERRAVDQTIAGLKEIALRLGVHILVVSHVSRSEKDTDDNNPTLNKIRHSHAVAQYADQVLGLQRHRASNETTITTLKVSRLWGQYGQTTLEWLNYEYTDKKKGGKHVSVPSHNPGFDSPIISVSSSVPTIDERPQREIEYGLSTSSWGTPLHSVEGQPRDDCEPSICAMVDYVQLSISGLDGGLDGTEGEGAQTEQEGGERWVSQRPGKGRVSSKREPPTQHSEGPLCPSSEDVHTGLHAKNWGQGPHDRSQGCAVGGATNQVQGSEGQLPDDSPVPGSPGSGTRVHLSERGWEVVSEELGESDVPSVGSA